MRLIINSALLVIGIVVGYILHRYWTVPLEEKINAVDVVTLLATVFLAVYIPSFLEKHLHRERFEKEVIIRKVEKLQTTLAEINKVVSECVQKGSVSNANSYLIINHFT